MIGIKISSILNIGKHGSDTTNSAALMADPPFALNYNSTGG